MQAQSQTTLPTVAGNMQLLVNIEKFGAEDFGSFHTCLSVDMNGLNKWEKTGSKEAVLFWLMSNSYEVLWYHLDKFILHNRTVFNHSSKKSISTEKALDRCIDFQQWIAGNKYNYKVFFQPIVNMQSHLKNSLPNINNNSYKSSEEKLNRIVATAESLLTWLKNNYHK